jgi:hypothetical protein
MNEPERISEYNVDEDSFKIYLKPLAIEIIQCFKERYGSLPENIDDVQESKCFENNVHETEDHIYGYIKDHWEELIGVTGLICPFCGSKDVVSSEIYGEGYYFCKKEKEHFKVEKA